MIGRLVAVGDNGIFASDASGRYSLSFTRPDTPRGLAGGSVSGDLADWVSLAHAILAEAEIIQREKDA